MHCILFRVIKNETKKHHHVHAFIMHVLRFGFRRKKNKEKHLPQELQMKVDRGGALPPGWQRKLVRGEILEELIYNHSEVVIPLDSKGLLTVHGEGKLIQLVEATMKRLIPITGPALNIWSVSSQRFICRPRSLLKGNINWCLSTPDL